MLELYYADNFELPLPENHRFPMSKYRLLRERLDACGFADRLQLQNPPAATDEQLLLVHTSDYLQRLKCGELSDLEVRRIGFPWSEKMVERSRRSTGASISAGFAAIESGVAGNLAGGTHHSFADHGQGYCVFNDVCVAAKCLQEQGLIQNALIIDCDVHQGNGTAAITKDDSSMFSFSMHCQKNYPFKKMASDLDVALPEGTGDDEFLNALQMSLDGIFTDFDADIVFYLAGADPFEGDRLGLMRLTKEGLQQRDEIVFSECRKRGIPLAFCMAGGYAPEVEDIVDIHFGTVKTAFDTFFSTS